MPGKLPWFRFYPDAWLSDERLNQCSLAAQGLWIKLLSLMHKSGRRGYLQDSKGTPIPIERIARLSGCSVDEVRPVLQELHDLGVTSVSDDGLIFSRRMVAEERKRSLCSEAGQKGGGNPTLKGQSKGQSKGEVKGTSILYPLTSSSTSEVELGVQGGNGAYCRAPPVLNDHEEAFEAFFAAYPSKTGKNPAARQWRALNPSRELASVIIEAVKLQTGWESWRNGYVPNPAKWLAEERWNDEEPVKPSRNGHDETTSQRLARLRGK